MAFTQSDIDIVEAAIIARINGGAVNSYAIGTRNVEYMKLDELRALRDDMKREVGRAANPTRTALANFRRGN